MSDLLRCYRCGTSRPDADVQRHDRVYSTWLHFGHDPAPEPPLCKWCRADDERLAARRTRLGEERRRAS